MYTDEEKEINVNEPEYDPEERPYYDDDAEKEEKEKVPVEYLGYLQKQREHRRDQFIFWVLLLIIAIGFAPGTKGRDYCPRTGEWRNHFTFGWGLFDYPDPVARPTEWTEWYMEKNPEPHEMHWVPYGTIQPAIFGYIGLPGGRELGWEMPENLVERMRELDSLFRPGYIMEIPRVLNAVNNAEEWNAIILPLVTGTPQEAYRWWNSHDNRLLAWAQEPIGTPLPQAYIDEATQYMEEMLEPQGNHIPILPD